MSKKGSKYLWYIVYWGLLRIIIVNKKTFKYFFEIKEQVISIAKKEMK